MAKLQHITRRMKVLKLKILNGPNYWSIRKTQLVEMVLDLEDLEEKPTNLIPGFAARIEALLPSMHRHQCSEGVPGGFFMRVKDGTWMGHVIEHIALELQTLAGMDVGFGRTRGNGQHGQYHVVFAYQVKQAGLYAAQAAVAIAQALVDGTPYSIENDLEQLRLLNEQYSLGPSTWSIVAEARKRGIPVMRLDDGALVQLGYGKQLKKIEATLTSSTNIISVEMAGNKDRTKKILEDAFVPVPSGIVIASESELEEAIATVGFPVVVKPLDGNQGKGATTDIRNLACARDAFHRAQAISENVIVEQFIPGRDFRALVINYQLEAVAMRTPAAVTGNGRQTIRQLIDAVNADPRRGNGHSNVLSKIKVDEATLEILRKQNLSLDSVLPHGRELWLKTTANLSTGGTAEDVTNAVHPANKILFERIARNMGLDICGIDVMAPDLTRPMVENGGAVIEVNAAPGLRMHLEPTSGTPRNVAEPIVDMLFPQGGNGRIPLIAVTGTNGKTTTSRLLAGMARQAGFQTGLTTTDGIYINGSQVYKGDCAGPASAQVILKDPSIEFAILETARGGILRSGLGYDQCDCAVVTNVAEDHLGIEGINTIEQLAKVKAVVPETVKEDGYAVLNADDDLVYAMKDRVRCKVALFSIYPDSVRIQQHCEAGGRAAILDEGYLIIREGNRLLPLDEVQNLPITMGGKAVFNIYNAMGAALAAYCTGVTMPAIRATLRNFRNSVSTTPGRLNEFNFGDFTILVDYAHNVHGLKAIGQLVHALPATRRVGVIAGIGDRRSEDIVNLATESARIFDEIIIRQDEDLRGRTEFEISSLLRSGIQKVAANKKVSYFSNEPSAIDHAVHSATPGSLTVIFVDNVQSVCSRVQEHLNRYSSERAQIRTAV